MLSFIHHLFPVRSVAIGSILVWSLSLSGCQLLPLAPDTPPPTTWSEKVESVATHEFSLSANQAMVGTLAQVASRDTDTLSDIARHFGLGFNDMVIANPGLDAWKLTNDQPVLLPLQFVLPDAPRKGIVLNLANMRLFYYPKNLPQSLVTYPVGIGRQGWNTPMGATQIVAKKANPSWTVPESIHREHQQLGDPLPKVIRAGPDNPLGNYAMPLGFSGYLIHGTNKPYGIGMQVSHGCVQLYPEDIEVLFKQVDVGTAVRIVHQPYLVAWEQNMLYLEAHEPLEKWAKQTKQLQKETRKKLEKMAAEKQLNVDWPRVDEVLRRADGIPTPVLMQSPDLPGLIAEAVEVAHPQQLYGQPQIADLTDSDWSIVTSVLDNETDAQKLAAMLNHQGPPIPARKIVKDGSYQVVAGPFKTRQEAKTIAKRIKNNFDMDVQAVEPKVMQN